ncbi:hypothetical protein JMJ77_0008050 [Colletotrichum scovillei]|uniref:Uncharacterized protein n=1 Tax=Colletotrichum scovillei TaxID=1209932 RepID=A0A9P7RE51_9PEZI|nr:hypothetical protein JMJ77_0008050 [Colletotrichum scovillei]KAG7075071.1 hypothetical protein JMJ76_0011534 [Colletotrichum scovillei]KAG7082365.1 hypothetical protein JMJ78_0004468 [Colletotrichum scovillei]
MPLFATFLAVSLVSLYTAGFATIIIRDNNDKQTSNPHEEIEELLEKREDENEVLEEKRRENISPETMTMRRDGYYYDDTYEYRDYQHSPSEGEWRY